MTRPASSAHPKSSLDLVIQWLPECGNQDAFRRQITKWRADLSLAMSERLNDIRPDRMEPRARKRQPKSSSVLLLPMLKWQLEDDPEGCAKLKYPKKGALKGCIRKALGLADLGQDKTASSADSSGQDECHLHRKALNELRRKRG